MISFIGQVLLVFGLAGTAFVMLPPEIYLLVGLLAALVVAGLMHAVEGEHLDITFGYLSTTIMIGTIFGAFWPALPVIVVWGGVKRRREARRALDEKDSQRLSRPQDP